MADRNRTIILHRALNACLPELCMKVRELSMILTYLQSKEVLNQIQRQTIEKHVTEYDKIGELINMVKCADCTACDHFLEALKYANQSHLVRTIMIEVAKIPENENETSNSTARNNEGELPAKRIRLGVDDNNSDPNVHQQHVKEYAAPGISIVSKHELLQSQQSDLQTEPVPCPSTGGSIIASSEHYSYVQQLQTASFSSPSNIQNENQSEFALAASHSISAGSYTNTDTFSQELSVDISHNDPVTQSPTDELHTLTALNCKGLATSFIVTQDGAGAYYFVNKYQSFEYVNFASEKQASFSMGKFKSFDGAFEVQSTMLFTKYEDINSKLNLCKTKTDPTNFIGLVKEARSRRFFCVLFTADIDKKSVSIVDEFEANPKRLLQTEIYIYKSTCLQFFCFIYSVNTLLIQKISLTNDGKFELIDVKQMEHTEIPKRSPLLYVDNEVVKCLERRQQKFFEFRDVAFSEGKGQSSKNIPATGEFPEVLSEFFSPCYSNGFLYFCSNDGGNQTTIWAFDTEKLCLSKTKVFHHYDTSKWSERLLQIFPDGSGFLLCCDDERTDMSHIYQFDLSVENKYFTSGKELGSGASGTIFEGNFNDEPKIAHKILHSFLNDSVETKKKIFLAAISEAKKLKRLRHANIVEGYGFKFMKTQLYVFMELMDESVKQKIFRTPEKKLRDQEAINIAQQVLKALVYLHTLKPTPIVHRDIKCANILLTVNGFPKLGDIGLMKAANLNTAETNEIDYWQAPEVLDAESVYGCKADIWSIGCSLVEMLTGYPPYRNIPPAQWAVGLYNNKLNYNPTLFVPEVSSIIIEILQKTFRRETNGDIHSSDHIRPHSWELLADVIEANTLKPIEEKKRSLERKAETVRAKIAYLRGTRWMLNGFVLEKEDDPERFDLIVPGGITDVLQPVKCCKD